MPEIDITVDVRLTPAVARWSLSALLLLSCAPELASEAVTLSTYYPAPSGVYTQMITTGSTWLARDATGTQAVIIGNNVASAGQMLDVYSRMGAANNAAIRATYPSGGGLAGTEFAALAHRSGFWSALYANQGAAAYALYTSGTVLHNSGGIFGNYGLTPNYQNWAAYGTGDGGAAIYNDNGGFHRLMIVGNNSSGGNRRVGIWDDLHVYGSQITAGAMAASASCTNSSWTAGASVGVSPACNGAQYLTLQTGFASEYVVPPNEDAPGSGTAFCCPCPAEGCPF